MSQLEHAIISYFQKKGYDNTARSLRREIGATKDVRYEGQALNEVFTYYYENPGKFGQSKKRARPEDEEAVKSEVAVPTPSGPSERMFIGNLSFDVTEESLKRFFASCGEILSVDWVLDKTTGKFYGTAFIVFDSVISGQKALSMNGKPFLQRPIKINFAPHKVQPLKAGNVRTMPPAPMIYDKPPDCKTLFMGNLSFNITEDDIYSMFEKCGPIYQVRLLRRDDGEIKGVGYVEFEHESSISDALKMHSKPLCGRPVRLDFS